MIESRNCGRRNNDLRTLHRHSREAGKTSPQGEVSRNGQTSPQGEVSRNGQTSPQGEVSKSGQVVSSSRSRSIPAEAGSRPKRWRDDNYLTTSLMSLVATAPNRPEDVLRDSTHPVSQRARQRLGAVPGIRGSFADFRCHAYSQFRA